MSIERTWLPFVALAVLALVALVIAGSRGIVQRTFALGAPHQNQVAVLSASQRICEGPVSSQGSFQSVEIWGAAVDRGTNLAVGIEDASGGGSLAGGRFRAKTAPSAYLVKLARSVPGGRPISVCLVNQGTATFTLLGSAAIHPGIVMSGKKPGLEFSLVLLSDKRQSLLGALGKAFSRASLFRPSWVGRWTFWVLAIGLLATIALGAMAIASAARADSDDGSPAADDHNQSVR
jgi:hypothetical protein